jgi:hypothetical protein
VGAIGADQVGCVGFEALSENADVAVRLDRTNRGARPELRARTLGLFEQEPVEPIAHDHVSEWRAGIADEPVAAPVGNIEQADGILDDGVDGEWEEALGAKRNAAAAGLVARELRPVEDEDACSAGRKFAGGRAAGGAGANHNGVEAGHRARL